MNWLMLVCAFLAALSFAMAGRIWRLDRCSSLTAKFAVSCLVGAFYELSTSVMVAIPYVPWYEFLLSITSTFYLLLGPLVTITLLDFSGVRNPWRAFFTAPIAAMSLTQIVLVWTGKWVVKGLYPTVWSNVYHLTENGLVGNLYRYYSLLQAIVIVAALVFAWFRSRSKRYRAIVLATILMGIAANVWGIYAAAIIWLKWNLPDPSCIGAGIILVGYSWLIDRYQHLTERKPDMTGPLLASLKGTVLFVDATGKVVQAPAEAVSLLGGPVEGLSIMDVLSDWPECVHAWIDMLTDFQPKIDLSGIVGAARYRVSILPHRNPFDQFDGALVRIAPEGAIDTTLPASGLSVREQEVARLVCDGYDTRQIAEALSSSPSTVKNHLHNIFEKTGTSNRVALVGALLSQPAGKID